MSYQEESSKKEPKIEVSLIDKKRSRNIGNQFN